ncbi:hypothetical protein L249_7549 [Ophiocordyceps polyrhachis-furcata BCC 54312]|uniref:Uncharacterized protein n=1 Tax=Ophiocordyceps polyrhachis-furcata BCC 54312 TaxID=1330021 RepID=A0A367LBH7_9HYPO|nr:hypothetical protein L249_7549 [Ophiocordyceps polyrhachis-furcata BCC 54312]
MIPLLGVVILSFGLRSKAMKLHGPLDLASLHLEEPEVKFIFNRVKRAVTGRTIPYFDVYLHENRTQLGSDTRERFVNSRLGLQCGPGLFYRHTVLSGYEVNLQPFAHQDFESVNTHWNQEASITLTQTTATTEDTSVEWRVDSSVTESRQDTTTETSEESLGGSIETSTSFKIQNTTNYFQSAKTGIDFYGFSMETAAHDSFTYMNTAITSSKDSQSNGEKSTESFTLSDALRSTTTSGQNSNRGNSKTFTQDLSLTVSCPARHLCEVQTWTFTAKVKGSCALIPFFDFGRCPIHDGLAKAGRYDMKKGKFEYQLLPPVNITLGALNLTFENRWFEYVRSMFMTGPYIAKDKSRSHDVGNGLVYPASNVKVKYINTAHCEVSFPLLQSGGMPYRVQILFQEKLPSPSARRRRYATPGKKNKVGVRVLYSDFP